MTIRSLLTRYSSLVTRHSSLISALLAAAVAAAPLFSNPGFLITRGVGDTPNLLFRLHQLLAALGSGEFPARWMPEGDFGYGLPYFTYYASLSTYLAALFKVYGFPITLALKLTQLTALLTAAGGAYLWARSLNASRGQAWLASTAYTFAPFHLVNLYVRGDSLAELWAMSFYPFALWAAQCFIRRPGVRRAFVLALVTGLLILTHNVSALNFLPFLMLYIVLSGWRAHGRWQVTSDARHVIPHSSLVTGFLALGWGLALSAFFWLPALLEIKDVQIGDLTQGFFFYGRHFRGLNLVQTSLFFNPDSESTLSTPFSMGLAQALAAIAGLAALTLRAWRARRWTWLDTFLVFSFCLATLMVTPLSAWLWEHLPLLRYTQFPWRFLSIQSLFAAMITARLVADPRSGAEMALGTSSTRDSNFDAPPIRHLSFAIGHWSFAIRHLSLAIGHSSFVIFTGLALAVFSLGRLRLDFIPLTDADVTAARLNLYEYFTGSIGNTVNNEYLPRWVTPRPFVSEVFLDRAPRLKALRGEASGARQWKRGASEQWSIQVTGSAATVAVPTHYWPGWAAEVDGRPVATRPADSLGWIAFDLGPGAHVVTLRLGRTPLRAAAEIISLLALLAPLAYFLYRKVRKERRELSLDFGIRRLGLGIWGLGFGILGLGFFILHLLPAPAGSLLPLSMDFDQLAYPHRDVIRFEGGAQLVRADYSANHLRRGDTLIIHTEWQMADPGEATFSLVPQSNLISPVSVTLVSVTTSLNSSSNSQLFLPIPANIPPGVYFVTVSLADASGPRHTLTSTGRVRGRVYLAPLWIDDPGSPAPSTAPLADFGSAIQLITATTENSAPGLLRVQLLWHALADVPHNYQLSLRLRDSAGNEWAASDAQAAYGFYPTHLWRSGEVIPDFYSLPLPAGAPPGDYALTLSLYDFATLKSIGETRLAAHLSTATPAGARPVRFRLTPDMALSDVEFPQQMTQGDAPTISASWLALAAPRGKYRARWTLARSDGTGTPFAQTLDLAPGSSPETWPAGSLILGRVRLSLPNTLAPGPYRLSVTLVDGQDQPVGDEVGVGSVEVLGRVRAFTVPVFQTEGGATFGGKLKLWGYTADRSDSELKLTLVWGALAEPGADYKFFVHLFNPVDNAIVAQVDAMPHDFTYPTTLWVAGEVVTDTVTLSLADVPPGVYRLGVGWYDPNSPTLDRLLALDAQGRPLEDNRVILPLVIEAP